MASRTIHREVSLHTGQDLSLQAPAGAELFCAAGSVRVAWAGVPLPVRVLQAGQALRVPDRCVLLVTGLAASRCRWTQAQETRAAPKDNSLRPWGRRLSTGS